MPQNHEKNNESLHLMISKRIIKKCLANVTGRKKKYYHQVVNFPSYKKTKSVEEILERAIMDRRLGNCDLLINIF